MSVAGTAGDRTLSGVKAGVLGKGSSEAVNGAQLFATNTNVESNTTAIAKIANDVNTGSMGLVKQDAESLALTVAAGTGGSTMSVAGTAGDRTLSGVKAGVLGKGSSEAVNGAQLFATNANVEANAGNISENGKKIATNAADIATNKATIALNTSDIVTNKTNIAANTAGIKNVGDNVSGMALSLGGGASVDANGKFVAPSYSVQGLKVNSVGGALTALNDGVDTNKTSIANITKDIDSGNVGLVKQDANTLALTVAASTGGTSMSLAGINGSRVLSGVKAGRTNDDAVNVSQLKNLFDELGASDALIDETNGKIKGPRYIIQGTSYNLSDSLAALDARMGAINTNMTNV